MTTTEPNTRPEPIRAYECAPIGLDGHRWPCPAAETAGAECADQGCGVGVATVQAPAPRPSDAGWVEVLPAREAVRVPAETPHLVARAIAILDAFEPKVNELEDICGRIREASDTVLRALLAEGTGSDEAYERAMVLTGWRDVWLRVTEIGERFDPVEAMPSFSFDPSSTSAVEGQA